MSCAYAHPRYLRSLASADRLVPLLHSGGALVMRRIPGTDLDDATGPYPLLMCSEWSRLADDLAALEVRLVCAVCVLDPFVSSESMDDLRRAFPDVLRPYKPHHVVDLAGSWEATIARHHLRNARKALAQADIVVSEAPVAHVEEWCSLYEGLVRRHGIDGPARFSRRAFAEQLSVPGAVLFRAVADGVTTGAALWYRCSDRGYYHLGAYTDAGYRTAVSHAIFLTALRWFAERAVRWLDLGAGAGVTQDASDGLNRFKRGWANDSRMAYLGGRIFEADAYRRLAGRVDASGAYFPAYREGSAPAPREARG